MKIPEFNQEQLELDWWVEITTKQPFCIYYFGPFLNVTEAEWFLPGYMEDIQQEGCDEISIQIKQCQPQELTICTQADRPVESVTLVES